MPYLKKEMKSLKQNEIISNCKQLGYNTKDIGLLQKTIGFLKKNVKGSLERNIQIAKILVENRFSSEIICGGLLFETERKFNQKELEAEFGKKITKIVFSQPILQEIEFKTRTTSNEKIREIILSTMLDIRVIIIRLASKLNQLKSFKECSKENKRIAKEIIEIYAPIATRLEIDSLRKELIDIAFKIINPRKYKEIERYLKDSKEERRNYIARVVIQFESLLKPKIEKIKIKGREKQIYSIYEKIRKRKIPLHKQKDHFAIRIITDSIENCYNIFSIITKENPPLEKTFKDYIKNPKKNGYQSIHLVIKFKSKTLEIQIRTEKMDVTAEEGMASHWSYKKMDSGTKFEKKTSWLKDILKMKNQKPIQGMKLNFLKDKIYCYTPKGKGLEFPKGSTVLDFAYGIHAEIGNTAVGGKVNGKFTALKHPLKNGDIVEILRNKFQRPRRDWMKIVLTKYAKKIIAKNVQKYEHLPVTKRTSIKKEKEEKLDSLVIAKNFPNHKIDFAKCCNPLPPEEIIGVIKSYKKMLIHRKDCRWIKESKRSYASIMWKDKFKNPIKIMVNSEDRLGILTDILNSISKKKIIILETNAKLIGNQRVGCLFKIKVDDAKMLEEIIKIIKKIRGIIKVWLEIN